ncbi:hypothetical protein AB0C93_02955 [Streptomyces sp. NPDC048518]|uniref:hypothetical protein n=1 Tax=Streptomyces sp. NPDC048518 TaxID=3155029 RepID=UPI0033C7F0FE
MLHDLGELGRVGRVLYEVMGLLEDERKRLEQLYGETPADQCAAGSPRQTLHGIGDLTRGVSDALRYVALALGYVALGLDARADHAVKMARMKPVSVPSGVDRMARPLGASTVRALELIGQLDDFFGGGIGMAVEVTLAAPQATYPPDDWEAYQRQQMNRPD